MKKEKLNLNDLKLDSFITSLEDEKRKVLLTGFPKSDICIPPKSPKAPNDGPDDSGWDGIGNRVSRIFNTLCCGGFSFFC